MTPCLDLLNFQFHVVLDYLNPLFVNLDSLTLKVNANPDVNHIIILSYHQGSNKAVAIEAIASMPFDFVLVHLNFKAFFAI